MSTTKVLFFASLGDLVGQPEIDLELAEEVTVSRLVEILEEAHPELARYDRRYRVAVNQVFAQHEQAVKPGDEVALIPPVSGGAGPVVRAAVRDEALDMEALTREVMSPSCGAVVTFMGTVRDLTGEMVPEKLHYSAYQEMAEKELHDICREAQQRWQLGGAVVEHRVGDLKPGEIAVVAACSAPHREEAFEGARFLIDTTKERVPLWKKEFGPDGSSWI